MGGGTENTQSLTNLKREHPSRDLRDKFCDFDFNRIIGMLNYIIVSMYQESKFNIYYYSTHFNIVS